MNVQHGTTKRPSAHHNAASSQLSDVSSPLSARRTAGARLIEEMLGVSGDDDVTYRVISELEELLRVLSWSLVEENHAESSIASMAWNRARVAVELYERRGLLRGGLAALERQNETVAIDAAAEE